MKGLHEYSTIYLRKATQLLTFVSTSAYDMLIFVLTRRCRMFDEESQYLEIHSLGA